MGGAVTLKGTRPGLVITLGEGKLDEVLAELQGLLVARRNFLRGGRVALQAGERRLTPPDVERIRDLLAAHQVQLWALFGTNPGTRVAAAQFGLATAFPAPSPVATAEGQSEGEEGILIRRTLRSGQSIRHTGYVVIIGDVNPGAEVVAGGDVIVWGHLRGTVHAGAMGDDGRCVYALDLSPTQLRIGRHIARPPEGKRRREVRPERAFVSDGQIVAERWK